MDISNSDKALLITVSSACFLVLVFFFISVKPYQGEPEEEYIEMAILTEPVLEELEQLESEIPDITTRLSNQAYNASDLNKESKSFDTEDEIRQAIEARQLETVQHLDADNDARLKALHQETDEALALQKQETQAAIDARESKRNRKKSSSYRQSTVSYNLVDRKAIKLPNPVYTCDAFGKIVINISVNNQGTITKKTYNRASSTSTNGCLIDQAMQYLGNAYFDNSSKPSQLGTVTFIFQG